MIGKASLATALAVGLGIGVATPAPAAAQSVTSIIACPIVLFFNPGTGSVSDYLDCSAFGPIAQGNGGGIFTNAAAAAVGSGNSNGFVTSSPAGGGSSGVKVTSPKTTKPGKNCSSNSGC